MLMDDDDNNLAFCSDQQAINDHFSLMFHETDALSTRGIANMIRKNGFDDAVARLFPAAEILDPVDGINKCFIQILQSRYNTNYGAEPSGGPWECNIEDPSLSFSLEQFKHLLTFGVDVSYDKYKALDTVCEYDDDTIAIYMMENLVFDTDAKQQKHIVTSLLSCGKVDALRIFTNDTTNFSNKAICAAFNHLPSVKFLVERGVCVEHLVSTYKNTYLNYNYNYSPDISAYLEAWILERLNTVGLDVLNDMLWLFVTYVSDFDISVLEALLDAGAVPDINMLKHVTSIYTNDNNFKLFMERFADKFDKSDHKLVKYAVMSRKTDHVRTLVEFGMKVTDKHIQNMIMFDQYEMLDVLVECGVDETRICQQVYAHFPNIIDFLQRHGIGIEKLTV